MDFRNRKLWRVEFSDGSVIGILTNNELLITRTARGWHHMKGWHIKYARAFLQNSNVLASCEEVDSERLDDWDALTIKD